MATSTSRPVLALEDLEDMDSGISLDEEILGVDEPITSPFAAKTEAEPSLEEDPFLEESLDALDDLMGTEPEEEPTPEVSPAPVVEPEKLKRTRRTKAEIDAEKAAKAPVVEDDGLSLDAEPDSVMVYGEPMERKTGASIDDLDIIDSIPEPKHPMVGVTATMIGEPDEDPFERLITPVGVSPQWMTIVAYGKNGTGKTTFGASGEKTLVAEVEKDGTFSVRDRGSKAKKFKVKTWDDIEKLYWYLHRNPGKYTILCIDTLTRLQELCLRSVVLNKKTEGAELKDKDIVKITLPQRGDIGQRMVFWLNAFNELPLHKVWLCQEASGTDDKDVANAEVYPDLQRKIRVYVCSDATVIGRTEIKYKTELVGGVMKEVPQFIMRTAPSESYLSKDRTKVLGAGLVNPKIDKLIEKVYA